MAPKPPIGSTGQLVLDLLLVLLFIVVAGIFVAAEIALISLRESQLRQMEAAGVKPKRTARLAKLTTNPNRFLAAAQVGVTFCGFLSAALGSERIGTSFVIPILQRWGLSHGLSTAISVVFVTLMIAYVSLVIGELVPKRLALYRTEQIALAAAPSIDRIANVFRPIIWVLSKSTDTIVNDANFTEDFKVYTSYIENEFNNQIPAFNYKESVAASKIASQKVVAEVNGHRFEVVLHSGAPAEKRHRIKSNSVAKNSGNSVVSPMQGTVVKIVKANGDRVEVGDLIVVLEAMKMEQPLIAQKAGVIAQLGVGAGQTVSSGQLLCVIED